MSAEGHPQLSLAEYIAPRMELSLDLGKFSNQGSDSILVGHLMLGTWSEELKACLRKDEPYRTMLKGTARPNFHREEVFLKDLLFTKMAERLEDMLSLIFHRLQ